MLARDWPNEEPTGALGRITRCEGESDESEGDLYFGWNSPGCRVAGCRVHVDKDANGQEKNVQVDTPFGGVHVNTDQISAADLGLPVYPGAEIVKDKDHEKSADVNMGFGEWTLRVRAVNYATVDSQDKVTAFYKKALGRYGDVITCQGNAPVGTPIATSEGLTCTTTAITET